MDSVKITAVDLKPVLGEKIWPSAYGGNTATFSKGIPPPPGDPGRGWNPRGGLPILLYRRSNNKTLFTKVKIGR